MAEDDAHRERVVVKYIRRNGPVPLSRLGVFLRSRGLHPSLQLKQWLTQRPGQFAVVPDDSADPPGPGPPVRGRWVCRLAADAPPAAAAPSPAVPLSDAAALRAVTGCFSSRNVDTASLPALGDWLCAAGVTIPDGLRKFVQRHPHALEFDPKDPSQHVRVCAPACVRLPDDQAFAAALAQGGSD